MANIRHKSIIKLNDTQFFDLLTTELLKHGLVKVTGLGVFKLKHMKARSCYIVGSNKMGKIDSRVKLSFLPTKSLKINIQSYNGKKPK